MTTPEEAEGAGLIEARLRTAITTEAAYPGGLAGQRAALRRRGLTTPLLTIVEVTKDGRGLARAIARRVRDRYRFRNAPSRPESLAPLDRASRMSLQRAAEAMALNASLGRLQGVGARPVARVLRPLRRVLLRLLAPTLQAQETFNVAALQAIERLAERATPLENAAAAAGNELARRDPSVDDVDLSDPPER
jgi:hypothetical protein